MVTLGIGFVSTLADWCHGDRLGELFNLGLWVPGSTYLLRNCLEPCTKAPCLVNGHPKIPETPRRAQPMAWAPW